MNPKQRREIKDWYTDLALGRTIKAEDIERPAAELARREQGARLLQSLDDALAKIPATKTATGVMIDIDNDEYQKSIADLLAENDRLRSLLNEAHMALVSVSLANARFQGMSRDDAARMISEIDLLKRIEEAV